MAQGLAVLETSAPVTAVHTHVVEEITQFGVAKTVAIKLDIHAPPL